VMLLVGWVERHLASEPAPAVHQELLE